MPFESTLERMQIAPFAVRDELLPVSLCTRLSRSPKKTQLLGQHTYLRLKAVCALCRCTVHAISAHQQWCRFPRRPLSRKKISSWFWLITIYG